MLGSKNKDIPERGSAPGRFLMPGDVKPEASVAPLYSPHSTASSDSRNFGSIPTKGSFLALFGV